MNQRTFAPLQVTGSITSRDTIVSKGDGKAILDNIEIDGSVISVSSGTLTLPSTLKLGNVTYGWPSADGTSGQILQTDGSGGLSWATDATGGGSSASGFSGIELIESNGTFGTHYGSVSFEAGNFNLTFPTASSSLVKLDWTNGPASRAANETITGNWLFNNDVEFQDAGITRFIFASTSLGRFGLGDVTPEAFFEIASDSGITASISNTFFVDATNKRVGIGTTSPGYKLDVSGTARIIGNIITNASSGGIQFAALGDILKWNQVLNGNDLYFATGGGGTENSKVYLQSSGRVGIGTTSPKSKFQLVDAAPGSTSSGSFAILSSNTVGAVASISATSLTTGSVFSIKVPASTSHSGSYLLVKDVNDITYASLGHGGRLALRRDILSHGATSTCTGVGAPAAGCVDLAEEFPASESIPSGELVSVDLSNESDATVRKSARPYDDNIVGIVTSKPGIVLARSVYTGSSAEGYEAAEGNAIVALAGRVPLKVSDENGKVRKGDYLTSSSTPGVAMKATRNGRVVGIALANAQSDVVMTFINPHWLGREMDISQRLVAVSGDTSGQSLTLGAILDAVRSILADGSLELVKAVTGIFDTLQARIGRFGTVKTDSLETDSLELRDSATGDISCIELANGVLTAIPGQCDDSPRTTPRPSPIPTPTPTADPSQTPEPSPSEEPTPEPSPEPSPTPSPEPTPAPEPSESESLELVPDTPEPATVPMDTPPAPDQPLNNP